MKDNIERLFKESLENYTLPYNGAAWDSLSKKLDTASPSPFYKKWWFAASVAVVAAVSSLLLIQGSAESAAKTPALTTAENKPDTKPTTLTATEKEGTSNAAIAENIIPEERSAVTGNKTSVLPSEELKLAEYHIEPMPVGQQYVIGLSGGNDNGVKPTNNPSSGSSLSLPKTICLNEELEITNPNKEELVIVTQPNGKQTGIKAGGKSTLTANTAGTIRVISGTYAYNVEVLKPESSFFINQVSDSPFEDGVPEVRLEATGADNTVTWTTNAASSVQKGKILVVHPFREMEFEVTATSKDAQGCSITEKQTIRLDKRYNLIAENVINPSSTIPRNRIFMPEALKIRDVAFDLTIVDPKNGGIVYETSDSSQGWDGTDNRNGESARPNSMWIWKVVIKNPIQGEPSVYNGTVQVVENK